MDPLFILLMHYDNKIKKNITYDDINENVNENVLTYDYMINKINKTLEYYWGDYFCEYENFDYINNIMLYSIYCSCSNHNVNLPDDFSIDKINNMYNGLNEFIDDNFYLLYTSFLLKTNGYEWRWLENWKFEDLIMVLKFSLIFDEVDIFKILFDKLDDKIKSYVVHNMDSVYYGFGYPLDITDYLINIGYENPINYNLITKSYCSYHKSLIHDTNDYIICIPKQKNKQNIITKLMLLDKKFINNVYNEFINTKYKSIAYHENIFQIIKTYFYVTGDNENIIKLFSKNIKFINYLFRLHNVNDYFQIIIEQIILKYYKILLTNKTFNYKLNVLNFLYKNDEFYAKKYLWFVNNINCFNNNEKIKIISIFKKIGLLDDILNNYANNIITNYSIYIKIKKYYPTIKLYFSSDNIYQSLFNKNYKDIYNYYCDDNSIECKESKLMIITQNIEKIINLTLLKKDKHYWHNRMRVSKLLDLYEIFDPDKMNHFIDININSLSKCLVNKKIVNRINKLNMIDYSQDSTSLYFIFKKIFSKNGLKKAINLLTLNPTQYSLITQKMYKYRSYNKLKHILKHKYKLDDNEISDYI
jgi:hypothetical protein